MTFEGRGYLLLCEHCGVYVDAPKQPDMGGFDAGEITHSCGKPAVLVAVSGNQGTWLPKGARAFLHDLPTR